MHQPLPETKCYNNEINPLIYLHFMSLTTQEIEARATDLILEAYQGQDIIPPLIVTGKL